METTANLGNTIFSLKECGKMVKSLMTELHKHRFESPSVFCLWIQPFCPLSPRRFPPRLLVRMSSAKSQGAQDRSRGLIPGGGWWVLHLLTTKPCYTFQQTESSAWQKGNIIRIKKKAKERKEGSCYRGVRRIHKASRHKQEAQKQERKSEADYFSLL